MVERVFNRMKHHRKAATRHDRLDETFLANLQLIPIAIGSARVFAHFGLRPSSWR